MKFNKYSNVRSSFLLVGIGKRESRLFETAFTPMASGNKDRILEAREWLLGVICVFSTKSHLQECQVIKLLKEKGRPEDAKAFLNRAAIKVMKEADKRATFDKRGNCIWDGYFPGQHDLVNFSKAEEPHFSDNLRKAWGEAILVRTATEKADEARKNPIENKNINSLIAVGRAIAPIVNKKVEELRRRKALEDHQDSISLAVAAE